MPHSISQQAFLPRKATAEPLELLAPAKNADFGIAAIDHGADAVYIGGPSFGARASAGNAIADIARLADHAHRFDAHVHVALNTILRDDELEDARRIAWQVFEAGADALIVQDMGLLEFDLPPIQLHASTQCDIRTPEKARFLEGVGFSRLVLARELGLDEIAAIRRATSTALEFFVHGALCVSFSGQCAISHAFTGRSANRGECAQMCRLPYTLSDADGKILAREKHLLSLKDNDQTSNLDALIDAGIRSFKIEGRLKDLSYVKNVTAHYRKMLDAIMERRPEFRPAASGRCTFSFAPQPEKTFNRGATDYFLHGRQIDIAGFDTPKFAGEPVGKVARLGPGWFEVAGDAELHNGDGLSWFDGRGEPGELCGLRVNRVEGTRIFPASMPDNLAVGTQLLRNRDQAFERLLERKSAERRIGVAMQFSETPEGLALTIADEDGITATAALPCPKEPAQNAERARTAIRESLGKLGNTIFEAIEIGIAAEPPPFLPASTLNALRREAVEKLEAARLAARQRPPRAAPASPPPAYPQNALSWLGNVFNARARAFYERHGVALIEDAYECDREKGEVPLMVTKHCLRYSFHLCPKQAKGIRPDPMILAGSGERLILRFDCKRCEMHVVGRLKRG